MKFTLAITATLAGFVATAPVEVATDVTALEVPQLEARGADTSNELISGSCQPIIFVFARGSLESGNMGPIVGPGLCSGLKAKYSNRVACQGVGGAYTADVVSNLQPLGTTTAAIAEGLSMLNLAFSKCPDSKVLFGGYSQGTALMEQAVIKLSATNRNKLIGGIFFGYTRNSQTGGTIAGFPSSKLKVICHFDDVLCWGISFLISPGHLTYGLTDITPAITWLLSVIGALTS